MTRQHPQRAIRISAQGPFGSAVARQLGSLARPAGFAAEVSAPTAADGLAGLTAAGFPGAGFPASGGVAVLASFRECSRDLAAFAQAAASGGVAWLPVTLGFSRLRVGPLFEPGRAPCHACYATRLAQHAGTAGAAGADLERAFGQDSALGVNGYPPHLVVLAAGLALNLLLARPGGHAPGAAGRFFTIDPASDVVSSPQLIPVSGCAGCRPPEGRGRPAGSSRALRALAGQLEGDQPR